METMKYWTSFGYWILDITLESDDISPFAYVPLTYIVISRLACMENRFFHGRMTMVKNYFIWAVRSIFDSCSHWSYIMLKFLLPWDSVSSIATIFSRIPFTPHQYFLLLIFCLCHCFYCRSSWIYLRILCFISNACFSLSFSE